MKRHLPDRALTTLDRVEQVAQAGHVGELQGWVFTQIPYNKAFT